MTPLGRWLLDAFLATGLVKSGGEFRRLLRRAKGQARGIAVDRGIIRPQKKKIWKNSRARSLDRMIRRKRRRTSWYVQWIRSATGWACTLD